MAFGEEGPACQSRDSVFAGVVTDLTSRSLLVKRNLGEGAEIGGGSEGLSWELFGEEGDAEFLGGGAHAGVRGAEGEDLRKIAGRKVDRIEGAKGYCRIALVHYFSSFMENRIDQGEYLDFTAADFFLESLPCQEALAL